MYSTIKRKHCKCSENCEKFPTLGFQGYFAAHSPEEIKEKVGNKRKVAKRNKNARLGAVRKLKKEFHDEEINKKTLWYKSRRYEMTGICHEPGCTKITNKDSDKYFTWSVCHIVPKSLCPSVAYQVQNWVELCWEHHSDFDASFDKAAAMGIFKEAKRKFNQFKHLIPPEEMRKVNPNLLDA